MIKSNPVYKLKNKLCKSTSQSGYDRITSHLDVVFVNTTLEYKIKTSKSNVLYNKLESATHKSQFGVSIKTFTM